MIPASGSNTNPMLLDVKDMSSTRILQELVRWNQEAVTDSTRRHRTKVFGRFYDFRCKSSLVDKRVTK